MNPRDDNRRDGEPPAEAPEAAAAERSMFRRLLPVGLLLLGLVAFFAFDLDRFFSFQHLKEHRDILFQWKEEAGIWAPLAFMLAYALMTAFSIPGGLPASIAGGFLFGLYIGSVLITVGATVGAVAVFLAARTAIGDSLRRRAGPWIRRMQDGFSRDAMSYMLILRLIPLFPFWLVNLVPAFLGVRLWVYTVATVIGIIPGVIVFTSLGAGLDELIRAGEEPGLDVLLQPTFLIATIGLVVLAILPVLYKKFAARRRDR